MRTYQPYVVKQGDYLAKLAHLYDFEIFEVWNHPLNAELKAKRGSPDILYPGDILHIPMQEAAVGLPVRLKTTNRYIAIVPSVEINLTFVAFDEPLANLDCEVRGLPGDSTDGSNSHTTDGEGRLCLQVPPIVHSFDVYFPDPDISFPIRVGEMDPIDEPTGVTKRLANLAYLSATLGYASDCPDDVAADAIAAFQRRHELEPTGVMNDDTREALLQAHGS